MRGMLYNVRESRIALEGSGMTYVSFGYGKRNLVLIPGLSMRSVHGSGLPLAWMYRIFTKEFRVHVFDRRDDVPEGFTVSDFADDTATAMKGLSLGNADVFGVSQGGMIAQYLAINHPDLVRKLVLGVTLSRSNPTLERVVSFWVKKAEDGNYQDIVKDMMVLMYSKDYVRKYRWLFPILMRTIKLTEPKRFVSLAKACLTCKTYDLLDRIQCPVLVLGGEDDMIVTGEASYEIARKLDCDIYMYEGLGHSAYEEGRDFNRRVYDFLVS